MTEAEEAAKAIIDFYNGLPAEIIKEEYTDAFTRDAITCARAVLGKSLEIAATEIQRKMIICAQNWKKAQQQVTCGECRWMRDYCGECLNDRIVGRFLPPPNVDFGCIFGEVRDGKSAED